MSRIPIKIKLTSTQREINTQITNQMQKRIDVALVKALLNIRKRIVFRVAERIRNSPEYVSLTSGQLEGEFGLDNAKVRVENILNVWLSSITIKYVSVQIRGTQLKGGYTINIINDSFSDVINTPEARVNVGKIEI